MEIKQPDSKNVTIKKKKLRTHSLYMKFSSIFIVILVLITTISGIMLSSLTEKYLLNNKLKDMKAASNELSSLAIEYITSDSYEYYDYWQGGPEFSELINKMAIYYKALGATIFIVGTQGEIYAQYPLNNKAIEDIVSNPVHISWQITKKYDYDGLYYRLPDNRQYRTSLTDDDFYYNTGDFYGLYRDMGDEYLTVCKRLTHTSATNGQKVIDGSIIVSLPITYVMEAKSSVLNFYLLSSAGVIALAIIVVFLFTQKLTKPLKNLKDAAGKLAKGDFGAKIEKTTNDEIGDLVDSFNKMTLALANLDAVRNDFIANVSHELRTPMTSIKGFVDGIREGVIPPERQNYYLDIVHNEIERMNNLVNELLDLAKIQSGNEHLNIAPFNLIEMINDVIAKLEPLYMKKNITVKGTYEKKPENVIGDARSIERVIINLIHNAIKFTPEGGTIIIHSYYENGKVKVDVTDNGIGMTDEEVSMIFERFYKSDKSRGLDKKGMGLGLSIAHKIMLAHDETITVSSVLGKGTTFTITLKRDNI